MATEKTSITCTDTKEGTGQHDVPSSDGDISPSDCDGDGTEWQPGVMETMRKCKLTSTTIDILGHEGFTSFDILDHLDIGVLRSELREINLSMSQRHAFLSMIKSRQRRPLELELQPKSNQDFKGVTSVKHEIVLRKCNHELVNNLKVQEVLYLLRSDGVLTDVQYEHCNAMQHRYKKVEYLLEILEKGSQRSFLSFMRALRSTKQQHLANYIDEYVSKEGE